MQGLKCKQLFVETEIAQIDATEFAGNKNDIFKAIVRGNTLILIHVIKTSLVNLLAIIRMRQTTISFMGFFELDE